MKKIILAFVLVLSITNCAENPFTGKKTLAVVPNSEILPMAFQQYDEVIDGSDVLRGTDDAQMIKNVGQKITAAAIKWLDANGHKNYTDNYQWEYNLIDSEEVNAWAMPGGKVAFYTGILPIAQSETGIATIMGHEVAHALANHGQQRMSAGALQETVGVVGAAALGGEDTKNQELFNVAYGVGSQVLVMLPFSRKHETEADKIGLTLMAIAGYDPAEAASLWVRMSEASGGGGQPEFLSTHPSNEARIQNLNKWAGEAKETARHFGVTSFK